MRGPVSQVMPIVAVPSVDEVREFYVEKLGFDHHMAVVGNDGNLDFCTVVRNGGRIMLTRSEEPVPAKPSTEFYFQVDEVDAYRTELLARGLQPTEPQDMWWGDRVFIVTDPAGYRIWFYENRSDPRPPEGIKIV